MPCSFSTLARRLRVVGICCTMMFIAGCGSAQTGDVSGKVTLDGVNLEDGTITFEDPSKGIGQSAEIKAGAYKLVSPLKIGDYKVGVQPPPPPAPTAAPSTASKVVIPAKFRQPASSGLTATVKVGPNTADFNLTK